MSKDRLDKLWETYTTDLRQRKIGDKCKELHIATRWSVHDVIGRLEREYADKPGAKFIVIPAMDENDESNFDYPFGVGFTTRFYREQRDIMDDANWRALFMNEPIEREGRLYDDEELRRFFELARSRPRCDYRHLRYGRIRVRTMRSCLWLMCTVMSYYINDCVCNNGLPDVVDGVAH